MTLNEELANTKIVVADLRHLFMHLSLRPESVNNRHDSGIVTRCIKSLEYIVQSKEDALAMKNALAYK